ncbi:MAG: anthranilate phosphoribosyltransferase [Chitinispirillales bacterium]|jgi:anthranilate phosphoribosyltransferase|nr:anthranilate phosphoribosyltransferase [Chitinispirillales bacterium]
MDIQTAIKTVTAGKSLSIEEASRVFTDIMEGAATDAQIAGFIVGLRMKGETAEEITGAASVMRDKAARIDHPACRNLIDTCGTGGDGSNTFNISTAVALVAAGAGAKVAKHGNRSVSSRSGSADVLEALGVNINLSASQISVCLREVGIGFLFAPALHNAMKYAASARKQIGIRTIFNILGPLTNPARTTNQLLGVFSPDLTDTMAQALLNMGSLRAFVVHGFDPIDEISICGTTQISEIKEGKILTYKIEPEEFGLKKALPEMIAGHDSVFNASIIKGILEGKKGVPRDVVVLNAAFALCAASIAKDPHEGVVIAQKSIDSGAAMDKLRELILLSSQLAGKQMIPLTQTEEKDKKLSDGSVSAFTQTT